MGKREDPEPVEVGDSEIATIEAMLNVRFDDSERRSVLQSSESIDVQACPGSGKTTMLVAKLAILGRKWRWEDRGICVLSHTNAARHEIENKLVGYPGAHRLLAYPHFVGTIQTFTDRFLALPFLRGRGLDDITVDNDRFASRARSLIRQCRNADGFLQRQSNGTALVDGLRFTGAELAVESANGRLPDASTPTCRELQGLKERIAREGVFRFDDMYALAAKYIVDQPWVLPALRSRFPLVFVDEMQDTDRMQDELLQKLHESGSLVQRFGDCNQAIFRDPQTSSQTSFPSRRCVSVSGSRRFCQSIADLASPLTTAGSVQQLIGNPLVAGGKHTVFLFDSGTISRVLPAFGDLILEQAGMARRSGFCAYAVGFRKETGDGVDIGRLPHSIGNYYAGFDSSVTSESDRPHCMIDFLRKARFLARRDRNCFLATQAAIEGVLEHLRSSEIRTTAGERYTKTRLMACLEELDARSGTLLREELREMVIGEGPLTEDAWAESRDKLLSALSPLTAGAARVRDSGFLDWVEGKVTSPTGEARLEASRDCNVYLHHGMFGTVPIRLSTIHGCKGQTHTATLVLETYFKQNHDLKAVLPFLVGRDIKKRTPTLIEHMKRVFVAMTRPRELLCLAIRKDHVPEREQDVLKCRGWSIRDLTVAVSR